MSAPEQLLRPAERILRELRARYEVDAAGLLAGIRGRLEGHLDLAPLAVDADLQERRGPGGLGRVRTTASSAPRLRKIVLSEINLWPVIEGFALTIMPDPSLAAPIFAADFMLLPVLISANADVYGHAAITRDVLSPLRASFAQLGTRIGPEWTSHVSSGDGLHVRLTPRLVEPAFAALTAALGRYLEVVAEAPRRADDPAGSAESEGRAEQERFFVAFHAHGPRRGPLRHLFGEAWAERYSRLVFE